MRSDDTPSVRVLCLFSLSLSLSLSRSLPLFLSLSLFLAFRRSETCTGSATHQRRRKERKKGGKSGRENEFLPQNSNLFFSKVRRDHKGDFMSQECAAFLSFALSLSLVSDKRIMAWLVGKSLFISGCIFPMNAVRGRKEWVEGKKERNIAGNSDAAFVLYSAQINAGKKGLALFFFWFSPWFRLCIFFLSQSHCGLSLFHLSLFAHTLTGFVTTFRSSVQKCGSISLSLVISMILSLSIYPYVCKKVFWCAPAAEKMNSERFYILLGTETIYESSLLYGKYKWKNDIALSQL